MGKNDKKHNKGYSFNEGPSLEEWSKREVPMDSKAPLSSWIQRNNGKNNDKPLKDQRPTQTYDTSTDKDEPQDLSPNASLSAWIKRANKLNERNNSPTLGAKVNTRVPDSSYSEQPHLTPPPLDSGAFKQKEIEQQAEAERLQGTLDKFLDEGNKTLLPISIVSKLNEEQRELYNAKFKEIMSQIGGPVKGAEKRAEQQPTAMATSEVAATKTGHTNETSKNSATLLELPPAYKALDSMCKKLDSTFLFKSESRDARKKLKVLLEDATEAMKGMGDLSQKQKNEAITDLIKDEYKNIVTHLDKGALTKFERFWNDAYKATNGPKQDLESGKELLSTVMLGKKGGPGVGM